MSPLITHEQILNYFVYDPSTGYFFNKVRRGSSKEGVRADYAGGLYGRLLIAFQGRKYIAARMAWFYVHGEWPTPMVDHKDGDHNNNRRR